MRSRCLLAAVLFLVFCANTYGVQISVPEITAAPGSEITVEIIADDVTGIAGGKIVLEYDPVILTAKGTRKMDLFGDLLLVESLEVAGEVRLAMAGVAGLAGGSGTIIEVDFDISPDALGSSSTALNLLEVEFFDGAGNNLDIEIVNGSVNIKGVDITATGELIKLEVTIFMYGTHGLMADGDLTYALKSSAVNLDDFLGKDVTVQGSLIHEGLDGGPPYIDVVEVTVSITLPPVVKEHADGAPILALEAAYDEANVHGHTYIDIWEGSIPVDAEGFLEFQIVMFSGNPTFRGTVDLHTTDGATLRDSGAVDQNDLSAHPGTDLSQYARGQWYHRKISLAPLAGKTIDGVMIATDSNEHSAGVFRVYVDNIQITNDNGILEAIWMGEPTIPITGTNSATDTTLAGTTGMSNYAVTIVTETPVTPKGKLADTWGNIKSSR